MFFEDEQFILFNVVVLCVVKLRKIRKLLFYWGYNPVWVLAFTTIVLHSSLSLHSLMPIFARSSSTSSIPISFLAFLLISYLLFSILEIFWEFCVVPHCVSQPGYTTHYKPSVSLLCIRLFIFWLHILFYEQLLFFTSLKMFLSSFSFE